MAGSIFIPLKAVFDNKGIKNAQSEFGKLGKSLKGALGAVGVGLSIGALTNQLQAAAKAATADAKSQGLLAQALKNTVGATNEQISAVEQSISKMEGLAAVADDQIRPIFAQLTRVTGDLGQATSLTNLALDVAASTGRDLNSVAVALGRAYQGNTTALTRLGINVKGVSDPMAVLEKQFGGAAEAAAKLDPYQRLEIVFGNLQEQIGSALLPYLNELADFFTSAEGQDKLKQFASDVADIATSVIDLADSLQLSGILDDLATLIERFAALSKLNFGKLAEQDANAAMNSYVELYKSNRAAYDEKIAFLKRAGGKEAAALVAEIESYVLKNKPGTGQGGSVLDSYFGLTGLRGGLGTGIKITGRQGGQGSKGLTAAQKAAAEASKKAAEASKAAAEAAKKVAEAANEVAEKYLAAAESASDFAKANQDLLKSFVGLFGTAPELGAFEQSAVDAFTGIYDNIKAALSENLIDNTAANALNALTDAAVGSLQAIGAQRDALATQISAAKESIANAEALVKANEQLMDSFKGLFAVSPELGQFEQAASGAFESIFAQIDSAVADGAILQKAGNRLTSFANSAKEALVSIARQRDVLAGQIGVAKEQIATSKALVEANGSLMKSFMDIFAIVPEMGQFEKAANDSFKSIFDQISSAVGNGSILESAGKSLTKFAETTKNSLMAIARQRDVLGEKINIAKTVYGGVVGLANITSFLQTTTTSVTETVGKIVNGIGLITTNTFDVVSSGGLIDNFQALVDKTKTFARNLLNLKKLGLNKNLFAQLVSAGADAGGATAQAIIDGGSDTVGALNDLYSQLGDVANDIAAGVTDTLYEVGTSVVNSGFINGLLSQDKVLADAATNIANSFATSFTTSLKTAVTEKLPDLAGLIAQDESLATKAKNIATTFATAFSTDLKNAVTASLPDLASLIAQDEALKTQAKSLASTFATAFGEALKAALAAALTAALPDPNALGLYIPGLAGAGGSNGGLVTNIASNSKPTIFNVNVAAGVVTDPNQLARTVIDSVKKYERSNGSVWVAA